MKKHLLTMLALVALVGCNKENLNIPVGPTDNVYTISAAPFENEIGDAATKSANYSESAQKVTNLNIWVYNNSTGALVNNATGYQTYFTNKTEIDGDLLFPDMDTKNDIYMFTNVGQNTPPANKAAAADYKYTFSSYDSFKSAGFPMAAHYCFVPSDPSQSHSLTVQRLVSKYNVTFNFNGKNNYKFTLKSAKVCKSAKAIKPFVNESKASSISEVFTEADYLSTSELTAKGGELYLLENIQGNVFSSGVERSEKNIAPIAKDVTSYLQFEGELDKNDGTGYHKVTCRYYFGTGTYAGVQRNYNVPLTLTMTNSILDHDDWIVTPEDPYNTGYVVFSPSSLSIVGDGNWNAFSAQTKSAEGNNENVKYILSYNSSDWSSAGLTLQYRKGTSGSWSTYSGQELTGSYNFQIKSTYTGSTQKTVKIDAKDNSNSGLGSISINVTKKNVYIIATRTHQRMTGVTGPNSPFYENGDNPHDGEITAVSGSTFTLFEEEHDWDLNYETDKCHNFVYYELGYVDDSNAFHPFTNVQIKFGSYTTVYTADTIISSFFNNMYYEGSSNPYIPWTTSTSTKKICNATITVKDPGFEKTYTGNCVNFNYL